MSNVSFITIIHLIQFLNFIIHVYNKMFSLISVTSFNFNLKLILNDINFKEHTEEKQDQFCFK